MTRKLNDYWEKRSTQLMLENENDTKYTIKDILNIYNQATDNINKEIEKIYKNYAKDGVLSKEVLLTMLNTRETKTHYDNLLYVINNHIQDKELKKKLLAKYNAPAYSYRISRLQALQDNIDIEMKKISTLEEKVTKVRYVNTVEKSYYKNIYNIQKGVGVGFDFAQLNTNALKILLSHKWVEGQNYSQRIWGNTEKLGNYLKTNLTAGMITGRSIQKISKDLSECMNVGMFNATRLVRTEVNHFTNEATALAYEECGIDKYQFSATLDIKTCDRCAALDNKIFNIKDKKVGVNHPPMHPNDRCTTTPYIEEEEIQELQRRGKDKDDNYILVPSKMNYKEWAMQYAPDIYKKYYLDKNLPKIKAVEDNVLDKQLGFYDESNELKFIPKNAIINNVHIIAGEGTQTIFRSANKYAQIHGGQSENWTKKAGKIESGKYVFDVHWVEHKEFGKYDFKLKGKTLK